MARKPPKVRRVRTKKAAPRSAPRPKRAANTIDTPIEAEVVAVEAPLVEIDEAIPVEPRFDEADTEAELTAAAETSRLPHLEELDQEPATVPAEPAGSLVPVDPLSRYLAEIRRFRILSREEELEISKRYHRDHDPADAYKLVTANLRLVVKIANEFARASRNLLDLIQEGNVGLMEAVKNFDPYRGIRFPSYAVWWVRAYIYRYLINNWRLVKIGTTQAQRKLFFNLRKESDRLEAEGFAPQPKLLAQRMGVKESEVREMQERMSQSEISLDQPVGSDADVRLIDSIPDSSSNPEEIATESDWRTFAKEKVAAFAQTLEGKELDIFRERLLTEDPPTLQEIGARHGISRERVRQIETRLKKRLKDFLGAQASDLEP